MVRESQKSRVKSRKLKVWLTGLGVLLLTFNLRLSTALAQSQPAQFANINNVRYASAFPGAAASAKIAACIADLPSTGGTCDAQGLTGNQTWSSDPFSGVTVPGILLLGHATIAQQVAVSIPSNWTIVLDGTTINQSAQIVVPPTSQNVHIIGRGAGGKFNNQQTGYDGGFQDYACIQVGSYAPGYGATATTTLSSDVAAGTINLPVADSTGFAAGQDILLREKYVDVYRYAEWNVVSAVPDGTHVTLRYPTEHAYRSAGPTGVYGFTAGALAKNWSVKGCRFISTTTAPTASGSGPAIFVGTATDGEILDNDIENFGGRGILIGASEFPAGRVIVANNRLRRCGLVPDAGGSPSLEVYVQSSHVTFDSNQVYGANSHGISVHGLLNVITGNQVYGTTNSGSAGFSSDTAESIIFSGNLASNTAGAGFLAWGAGTENTTEASRLTYIGNVAQDTGGDGFSIGTSGSGGYVQSIVANSFAYRCRGGHGFAFYGTSGGYLTHNITGNTSEGNATGFYLGIAALGVRMVGNFSRNNTTGYSLNSPLHTIFMGNSDTGSTTPVALGTADYSVFIGNHGMGTPTGAFGSSSTVLGIIGVANQFPAGYQALNLNSNDVLGVTSLTATTLKHRRDLADQGTSLTSGDFGLSGWGSGASVAGCYGTDSAFSVAVTVGSTPSASPTITLTFKDGAWAYLPVPAVIEAAANPTRPGVSVTSSTTQLVIQLEGTPSAGSYTFYVSVRGKKS